MGIRQLEIMAVQSLDPLTEFGQPAVIGEHIVAEFQPRRTRKLRFHDGAHFHLAQAAARHGARNLLHLTAIDDQYSLHLLAQTARFEQKRHHQNCIGRIAGSQLLQGFGADQWMQQGFQFFSRLRIGKHFAAQFGAVESTIRLEDFFAELLADRGQYRAAGSSKFMRDNISVDPRRAALGKQARRAAFAAADAASQAHREKHNNRNALQNHWLRSGPQMSAINPAAAR